jgi:hypothetical protein
MPCTSDYAEPTAYEEFVSKTVMNLMYLRRMLGIATSEELTAAYKKCYYSKKEGDKWTAELCERLHKLSKKDMEKFVYDAHSKKARNLADWWEDHQEADKEREAKEKKDKKEASLKKKAAGKLTAAERKALGL